MKSIQNENTLVTEKIGKRINVAAKPPFIVITLIRTTKKLAAYFFPVMWSVVTLYPLFIALISSVKSNNEIFGSMFKLPKVYNFHFYMDAIEKANMLQSILNSLIITTSMTVILLIVSSMMSFVLARFRNKLTHIIYISFMFGIMLPIHSTLIPLARIISSMNGVNNYPVLVLVYIAFQLPISVFLITGYMKGISNEIYEAAVIDGCGLSGMLFKIYIPISVPIIGTSAILAFLSVYNELIFAVMFITDRNKFTVSQGLLYFVGDRSVQMGPIFASIILSIVPMLIIYLLFHESVQKGILAGAVKG